MPERAAAIRRAHLVDIAEALRQYVERGYPIELDTEYVAEDHGRLTIDIDLSQLHPIVNELTARRIALGAGSLDGAGPA